ncbi:hypothetical protein [uncultured Cocleimonas sp.]|uniref:hypothetical protein n=1 Tax=uncultured Cocleimonas sp. TaxID=1051587 RepID=UPI002636CF8A|nr:hypothetical protein [uncultured Cocleimonas sp.]
MVKVAILHEGNAKKTHDNELLLLLLDNLGLDEKNVKFFGMGTKSNFFKVDDKNYKELLLNIKNESIEKILFVLDADFEGNDEKYGGFENTKTELEKTLDKLDLNASTDIYITCDPDEKCGYLESLILSTIPEEQKECLNAFLDCSDFKSKENHKAILNQIYNIGYPNAPFDFSHTNFDVLKLKLQKLFEGV